MVQWFLRRGLLKVIKVFSICGYYFPFSSINKGHGHDLSKLTQLLWGRRVLQVINVFSLCGYYLPFQRGMALPLNKLEFHLPIDDLCQFDYNWPCGSGEEKLWKVYDNVNHNNDNDRQISETHLSLGSGELKTDICSWIVSAL